MRAVAAGVVVAARLVPVARVVAGPVRCPWHRLTGRPCPTCGMTRSVVTAAHGDLRGALAFHAVGPALLVALVATAAGAQPAARAAVDASPRSVRRAVIGAAVAVWVIYAVGRMRRPVTAR